MTSKTRFPIDDTPFVDEVFLNSPLCQICEYANMFGGVCSLLLNRRIPSSIIIKDSQIMSCSSHRNWVDFLDETLSKDEVPESMANVLKKHIEECPKHPMSKLKKENDKLRKLVRAAYSEGFTDGMGNNSESKTWEDSQSRQCLENGFEISDQN